MHKMGKLNGGDQSPPQLVFFLILYVEFLFRTVLKIIVKVDLKMFFVR